MSVWIVRPVTRRAAHLAAAAVALGVAVAVLPGLPAEAAPDPVEQAAQQEKVVSGAEAGAVSPALDDPAADAAKIRRPAPRWPAATTAEVAVPPAGAVQAGGGLPVTIAGGGAGAPARVRVQLLGRDATAAAGVDGLLLRAQRADGAGTPGPARISVDYSAVRDAFGADWASRLRLVRLPECMLDPAERAKAGADCRPEPVAAGNDVRAGTLTATVAMPAATLTGSTVATSGLLAVTAGGSGPAGSYGATSLAPSATWQAGSSSGDFSWSYPMRVPPALGGPVPALELSYSAQSVDGRTAASNNQPSWAGEGFEFWPGGYVERRYRGCAEDQAGGNNPTKTGDRCWATDNATLSLNGRTTELVRDDATGAFRPRTEDGSRVERMTGATNGDNDGEHWRVTTPDGTQYWFGRNRLPGWAAGRPETRSAWTVPVFGNQAGEPCHAGTFAASSCTQAWRWNLDHVVDPHGNSMSYWYTPQTNRYARNLNTGDAVSYVRDGSLDRIDYGTNTRSGNDSGFTTPAPFRVTFGGADRCLSGCTARTAAAWPDVPWDQECTGSPCSQHSPTFWSTRRLASVTTQLRDGAGYRDVESWSFTHSFPDPGDGTRAGLWLASIGHAGRAASGAPVTVPDVAFAGVQKPNRVDGNDHSPAMNWWRIADIRTETGGRISVKYTGPDCVAGSRMPAAAHTNTLRCYPVRWTPDLLTAPVTDWFHKYVVTDVVETDTVGGGGTSTPRVLTHYDYGGTPAWHWTDEELTPEKDRTWASWRGYERVTTVLGDTDTTRTATETRFYRGMHGDKLPSGTRSAVVTDSLGGTRTDDDWLAGTVREQRVLDGPGGAEVSGTLTEPWASAPTATRVAAGVTVSARYTNTAATRARVVLDGGRGTRTRLTSTTYDDRGQVLTVEDAGDEAVAGDEQCTRTTYARNTSAWLLTLPSRVQSFAVSCAQAQDPAALGEDDVIGDARTSYDGQAWGAAPVRGDVTRAEQLSGWNPARYATAGRTQYDVHGRATDSWDALDRHTGTAFTPATDGPVTRVTTTNAAGHVSTEDRDPAFGDPVLSVDANGRRTERSFDGLGRLTAVWLPDRPRSGPPTASYAYLMRNDKPTAVTASELDATGGYATSTTLFDGLLRERQTQREAAGGTAGRIVAETLYDSAGRPARAREAYLTTGDPGTDLFVPGGGDATIPRQTVTQFDGAGRPRVAAFVSLGVERWRSTTSYGGDRTDVVPPNGGTVSSTVIDARGRDVERRLFHGRTPSGPFDRIRYTIDRKGRQARIEDPAGNVWEYRYDLRGRQVRVSDPDKGVGTTTYDDAGQQVSATDGRGVTLVTEYDELGRRTALREGSATGPKRAEWVYDTVAKGLLSASVRYEGGEAYRSSVNAVDAGYRTTSASVTVPASQGGLAGTYTTALTYRPDGSPATTRLPAAGDLPAETLTTGYDADGNAATLTTSAAAGSYVSGTSYTALGEIGVTSRRTTDGRIVQVGQYYEEDTRRLNRTWVTGETAPATIADLRYRRDDSGQLLQLSDVPQGRPADVQCFENDYRQRLTEAWTPADGNCAAEPAVARLGGPAPYWRSWGYDVAGNRTERVDRAAAGTSTTTYALPPAGGVRPHAVSSGTTVDAAGTRTARYGYDAVGNTVSRPAPGGGEQVLTWDPEGHLVGSPGTELEFAL